MKASATDPLLAKNIPQYSQTLVVCLLIVVITGGIGGALYHREASLIEKDLRYRESSRVESRARLFAGDFQTVANDLRILVTGDGFRAYVESGAPEDLKRATQRAVFFKELQSGYDKIRYLDTNGQEVLRVNQVGGVVPPEKLQNKAERPFFRNAVNLPAGQILISAFDLNMENGLIEEPYKPTLRFSMPVKNAAGQPRGVYVINYLGDKLIARLLQVSSLYQHRIRLLNSGGYWLKAADASQQWGFMLPDRKGMTLAQTDPGLWAKIAREPTGQVRHAGGLFTWFRVLPAESVTLTPPAVSDEPFLVIASVVTAAEWAEAFGNLRLNFFVVGIILLLFTASSGWFFHQRGRAAADLRANRALLQAILDNTPAIVYLKDVAGRYLFINRRFEEVTGLGRDQLRGRTAAEFFPGEIARAAEEHHQAVLKVAAPLEFEETVNYPDGPHTHLAIKFPLRDPAGQVYATGGISTDISERKRAEEERDRFFSLSRDLMGIADFEGHFKVVNPAWKETLGFSPAEITAQPFIDLVHPDDRPATAAAAAELATGGEVVNFENRYRCRDGSYRWIKWNARSSIPQRLIYATGRDVTEQKKIEGEVNRLNGDLQQRAAQLQTANQELEAFSYSVSHDLRAPLRHIDGFLDLLVKNAGERLDDKGQRYVKIIGDSAKQMGNLIDDLLVFSRMGRAEMSRQKVDLNTMVEQVKEGLQHELQGRKIVWKIARLPHVEADAPMLRQVWANLIGNAIKYTRTRDPAEIEIGCREEKPGQPVFFVRDNGVGFDMQYVEKLFGVFQRLHRADEFEGTGIGLANVRRIVHRHGGRAWAEGAVDKGATFYYTLD